ncbi:hypothetical protein VH15_02220 [Corynebacterium ulcerans]|nr:hypothetical protein VH15_02220 [Corynebacterium ulcerans]
MSRINALISELSQRRVDFRQLGSIGKRNKGTVITATKMKELALATGPIRVFAGGQTVADVQEDAIPQKSIIRVPSIIVRSRGNIGFTYYNKPFTHKTELWSYSIDDPDVDQKFVYYYLLTEVPRLQEVARATSVKLPQLSVKDTDLLRIPVPPLEVQRVIVDILDKFVKLEAELEARKRQYEYYRRELLTFGEDVEWSSLGKVSLKVSSGGTPTKRVKRYYQDGSIPWLRTQEVFFSEVWKTEEFITEDAVAETSAKWIPKNCLIVAISGASAGRSAINKISLTTNQHCCNLQIDPDRMSYKFAFHWVSSNYQELKSLGRGARSDLNARIIQDFPIPVPPLPDQHRIVELLDKFDALVNDLSSGLPAEIAARRKQYEYYRDKLLTFKELAS